MTEQTMVNLKHRPDSCGFNFLPSIDRFGSAPYNLWIGNTFSDKKRTGAHYCIVSFKFNRWPEDDPLGEVLVFELGAYLPRSCDLTNDRNKYDQIARIAEYNERQANLNTVDPVGIYCLP